MYDHASQEDYRRQLNDTYRQAAEECNGESATPRQMAMGRLIGGVVAWVCGLAFWFYIGAAEAEVGEVYLPWFLAIPYMFLGRWGVTALCCLLGGWGIISGYRQLNYVAREEQWLAQMQSSADDTRDTSQDTAQGW
jgi:hypothetical protein